MAVARINKLELLAHISDKENILKALEKTAIVQVKIREETLSPQDLQQELQERTSVIHEQLSNVNFLLSLNKQFPFNKISAIDSFVPPKIKVKRRDFETALQDFPLNDLYEKMESLDVKLRQDKQTLKEAQNNIEALSPWRKLDFNPQETETENTLIFLGLLPNNKEEMFFLALQEQCPLCDYKLVEKDEKFTYAAIFVHKKEKDVYASVVKQFDFSQIKLPEVKNTINKTIADTKEQIKKLQFEINTSVEKIKEVDRYHDNLVVSRHYLLSEQEKLEIEHSFVETENVFVLEGWLKQSDAGKLKKIVSDISEFSVIQFSQPQKDEKPPIILQNPRWMKPLEAVTALYGMPSYDELDPTPYMAPFFLIFFGLAIGDVAYGLALVIISWALKKSSRLSANTKVFLTLFIYGGFAATFFGVITGSWLTLDPAVLPSVLKKFIVFEPLKQPALFLVITLLLGLVQLYFGVLLKLVATAKNESVSKAIQSEVPQLLVIPGVTLLIAEMLGFGLSKPLHVIAVYLTLGGSLGILLFSATEAKSILGRLGGGLFNLYSMSSFLGDTISYGRIMALGLATFLIGSAINTIILGGIIFKSLPIKILLGILVLPLIHIVNLAINTVSAFVHPARLQYVEFFGKFFEGGGRVFKPLKAKSDNIIIE